jgi:low affinity Fe/Cu permease
MSLRILAVGVITLLIIFVLFNMRKQKVTKEMLKESFGMQTKTEPAMVQNTSYINPVTLDSVLKSEFKQGNRKIRTYRRQVFGQTEMADRNTS